MKRLGVNIDHVATLRQVRGTSYPNILEAANAVIKGGADQITIHLREDRRHIQDNDLKTLLNKLSMPLNLELAATDEMVEIALQTSPSTVTFVPEKREELTTEGGLDVVSHFSSLQEKIVALINAGIKVSLFLDPELKQIEAAKELNVPNIELHTGNYCNEKGEAAQFELKRLVNANEFCKDAGLHVAAGHGLNLKNITQMLNAVPEIEEYNIGHSIVCDALHKGLEQATRDIKKLL